MFDGKALEDRLALEEKIKKLEEYYDKVSKDPNYSGYKLYLLENELESMKSLAFVLYLEHMGIKEI